MTSDARPLLPGSRARDRIVGGIEMKAITVEPRKPETARLEDIPEPDAREGSVLVEAIAVGVCGTDVEIVEGKYGWAAQLGHGTGSGRRTMPTKRSPFLRLLLVPGPPPDPGTRGRARGASRQGGPSLRAFSQQFSRRRSRSRRRRPQPRRRPPPRHPPPGALSPAVSRSTPATSASPRTPSCAHQGPQGASGEVSLEDDLGLNNHVDTFWLDATWRVGRRHTLKLGFTRSNRERADYTLQREFTWAGKPTTPG